MGSEPVHAGFERWAVFAKIRAADRMHHRAVGRALEKLLIAGFGRPPRILDVGCGDARDIAAILKRCTVAEYTGIDNSSVALECACGRLAGGAFPRRLIHGDYAEALATLAPAFDLIWLGLFLHHLSSEQKRELFRRTMGLLAEDGSLFVHDPVLLETEDREGFLGRIGREALGWPELTAEERDMLGRHWSQHGRQERISRLEEMAILAGFSEAQVQWRDPLELYALLAFGRRSRPSEILKTV
ncbi:MAG: class I SAM-dependent methyltransferase [Desulfobacterales bacterium]|jgi:SAM-dependent methyltransferase|nr:class I SAM-dependent methyltransferase [Desulfobacterales bacterium]